jgi:hypothetical protein
MLGVGTVRLSQVGLSASQVRDIAGVRRPVALRAHGRFLEAHRIPVLFEASNQPIRLALIQNHPMRDGHILEQRPSQHCRLQGSVRFYKVNERLEGANSAANRSQQESFER